MRWEGNSRTLPLFSCVLPCPTPRWASWLYAGLPPVPPPDMRGGGQGASCRLPCQPQPLHAPPLHPRTHHRGRHWPARRPGCGRRPRVLFAPQHTACGGAVAAAGAAEAAQGRVSCPRGPQQLTRSRWCRRGSLGPLRRPVMWTPGSSQVGRRDQKRCSWDAMGPSPPSLPPRSPRPGVPS